MKTLFGINYGIRFLLEIFSLIILVLKGFEVSFPWNFIYGLFFPIVFVLIWMNFISPKANFRIPIWLKILIECFVFAWVSIWLQSGLSLYFFIITLVNSLICKFGDTYSL